jgi:plastocyanin
MNGRSFRRGLVAVIAAAALGASACGGYGGGAPGGPDELDTPPAGAIVISVVGERGALSFSPNPATVPAGQLVSWHNVDNTVHHIVLNDGRLDAGNIGPGRYSRAMTLPAPGGYHCSIHPDMVGTLVGQ